MQQGIAKTKEEANTQQTKQKLILRIFKYILIVLFQFLQQIYTILKSFQN